MPSSKKNRIQTEKSEAEKRLQLAVIECRGQDDPNVAAIARKYGRHPATLRCRLNGRKPRKQAHEHQQLLSGKSEILFVRQLQAADAAHEGLTANEIRDFAQDILDALGENKQVGANWPYRMIERIPWIKMLSAKPTDQNRTYGVSLSAIEAFFQRYEDAVNWYNVDPSNIWNMDETGIFIHQFGKRRVAGDSSKKSTNVKSGNSKEITTVVEAISAAGEKINSPLGIFKSKTLMTNQTSEDETLPWAYAVSYKGWITGDHFQQWVRKIFIPQTKPENSEHYRILIMDNHATHYNEELKSLLLKARVIPIYLPAHCSHLMQPLDVAVFKPVKQYYRELLARYFRLQQRHVVEKSKFIEFWNGSRNQGMTEKNISSGFEKSGLWPINKQMVLENPELTKQNLDFSDGYAPSGDSSDANLCINGVSGVVDPKENLNSIERYKRAIQRENMHDSMINKQLVTQLRKENALLRSRLEQAENPRKPERKRKVQSMENGEVALSSEVIPKVKKLKQDIKNEGAKERGRRPLADITNTA
ncbi:hypothetical protein KGF57_003957 [Candida theae]|uniref:DDE-1 domain-containing protein n=1 Tax=Candida theae TaxID=1198502 RepID=A0AAD5FXJ5_9ASCO|nr:uncharacterized protein KGF57_003957 [Candida theae]KAI5953748.1 hypothetical protein KGF57_003957 [Candida theae]